jgi:hypothetical protein
VTGSATIRAAWVATLAAVLALALPQSAPAGFSSNLIPLSGLAPAGNTGVTDLAVNPSGEALVAWSEGAVADIEVKLRRVKPDGSFGPTITIEGDATRAHSPQVAFAPNGRAMVAWIEDESFSEPGSIRARWIEPNGTLGPPVIIINGGAAYRPGEHDVTATAANAALVAWHNFVSMPPPFRRVEARLVSPEGTASELIFPTSGGGSTGVVGAADTEGSVLVSWRDSGVQAQSISAGGVPGTLQTPAPGVVADPALTTDGDDHFHLLYRRTSPYSVEYKSLAPDGSSGAAQELEPLSPAQVGASYDLATNPANRTLAAWSLQEGTTYAVKARFIGPAGTPEDDTFTVPTGLSNQPAIKAAIGGNGTGALALELREEGEPDTIWGRLLPAGGPPGDPILLSTPTGNPRTPEMKIAPNDVGLIAWAEQLDPNDPTSQFQIYARQILPPPSCPDARETIVQGRPTRIDLRCTGLQLRAPEIVKPPAHGSLAAPDIASQSVVYTPKPGYDGPDSFSFRGTNPGGTGATQTASLDVGKDTIRPVIKRFRITGRGIATRAGASAKRRGGRGKARVLLRFSEPATARIILERPKRCLKHGPKRRCSKFRKLGTMRVRTARISATVALTRRIKKKLRPRRVYRARAIARDRAGNRSRAKRLGFVVARKATDPTPGGQRRSP